MKAEFIEKFVEENGFIGCVCTSAKTGVGVTEAMGSLVRRVLQHELYKAAREIENKKNRERTQSIQLQNGKFQNQNME